MNDPDFSILSGRRMAVVSFSGFPADPRPRRAAEAFTEAGMLVDVICLRENEEAKRASFQGMRVDRVSIRKSRSSKAAYILQYALFLTVVFFKLTGRSLYRRYHVVHIHNMPDVLVFAAIVPKLFGAKIILDLHDPMPELVTTIFDADQDSRVVRWMTRLERLSISFSTIAITVNRACEKIFTERSAPNGKVRVVMNSPDESLFEYTPVQLKADNDTNQQGPLRVMYHGTLVERNGLDLLIAALSQVNENERVAELRIYGKKTSFLEQVMNTLADNGLQDDVHFEGPKRLEELAELISECDVGVIPNNRSIFTEINTPTRIFEYLAIGKPVIAPRARGIQDYFSDDALIYFDLGDAEQLAQALAWVASHRVEALHVAKRGQAVYLEHTWSREKAKLLSIGTELLAPDRSMVFPAK